jgi:hypothetical protein
VTFAILAIFVLGVSTSCRELKDRRIVRGRRICEFTGLLIQIGRLKAKPV